MFGFKSASRKFTAEERRLVEKSAELLGDGALQWKHEHAEFVRGEQRTRVPVESLRRILKVKPGNDPVLAAIALAPLVGVSPPASILGDHSRLRHLLRPRLIHPRELQGPHRLMCRRETFGELLQAVAFGPRHDAPLLTTAVLDEWDESFESVFAEACRNYAEFVTNRDVLEVQGAPGLLALLHDREQAASAVFIMDRLFPPDLLPHGVVFAVPAGEVLLVFPVIENAGPDGLASIVQAAFSMSRERHDPLSDRTFWRRDGGIIELPMTSVEDRTSRRVHIEARGPLEDLLRVLGAIE